MSHDAVAALLSTTVPEDQFRFVEALLADPDMSIAGAERTCGLKPGTGARWLKDARVRECLGQLVRDRAQRHADIRDQVIIALWAMAGADPRKAWRNGVQLPPDELPDELAAILVSAEPIFSAGMPTGCYRYKFSSKQDLLLSLLKHFGDIAAGRDRTVAAGAIEAGTKIIFRGIDASVLDEG